MILVLAKIILPLILIPPYLCGPPVISKNVGESYSRTTYQLQFKPKLRTFNSSLTTVNKWYFEDNTLPTYLLGKINKDSRFYDTALNYTIGLIQPNSDELLEYNLNSIGSEFSNNNTIIGSIDTSTLPAALTNFSIVKAAINMENGTINNIFIIGGKDTSGSPVDTIYVSTLADDGSLGPWVLSSITLPVPLYNASCLFSTSESYLVIVGGNTGSDTYSSDIYTTYTNYFSGDINPFKTNSGILPVGLENAAIATVNISGYQYMVVAGGNNTSPLNSIYVIFTDYGEFNNYGAGYSFSFTLSQTLPFTGNFVSTSIYNQGYGFFLGNISDVMTLSYLYLTTNSDGSGNLVGSIENATITGAMSSIGTNSTLKIVIVSYPGITTEYYIGFMGEEDVTTNLYNMYVSNLIFNGTETSLFTNLQVNLGNWSKIITPISTASVNLNWSMNIDNSIVTVYNNLETITLDIGDAKNYFYIPDSTLNPFTTPPSNYYFIGSMKIDNIVTDDSLSISDLDLLSNAGSSLESKYKSNGYSFTNQDNFESVMEINGGTSPTFTLKYSNPDAINVNNLQEIADPLSTTSSTPGPGIKIYSYLTNLIPGMTINSINAKISSSKMPPHLSLNRAVS